MKGKVSLHYNQITIGLQLGYNQLNHLLHLESTQCKQFPQKKKKEQEKEAKDKGERQNEGKESEMEISGKKEKKKKGWKEFVRKERKDGRKEKRRGRKEKKRGRKKKEEEE